MKKEMKVYDVLRSAGEEIYKVYAEDYYRTERRVLEILRKQGKVKAGSEPKIKKFESNSKEGGWHYYFTLTTLEYKPEPNLRYSYDLTAYSILNDSLNADEKILVLWPSVLKGALEYEEIFVLRQHSVDRYFERLGIERPETFQECCEVLVKREFISSTVAINFFDFPTYREHRLRTRSGVFLGRSPDTGKSFTGVKKVQNYNTFVSDREIDERDDILQEGIKKDGNVFQAIEDMNYLMNLSNAEIKKLRDSGVDLDALGLNIV